MRESNWTDDELQYLIKRWHKDTYSDIARKLGKTKESVRQKAERIITFEMISNRRYSEYEDELLRKLYGTMSMDELSIRMKRTKQSLTKRIRAIEGCSDYMTLQDVYNTEDIAGFLGVSKMTLNRRIRKGNIPFYRKNRDYIIKHEDFWNWLTDNLDKVNYKAITSEYELIAPKWYSDIIKNKKWELRDTRSSSRWNSSEEALLWSEMMKGRNYKDIAKILNRSEEGVAKRAVMLSKKKMSKVS